MNQLITKLKNIFPLQDTTRVGDIVLIAAKTPEESLVYAQVGDIVRDETRKAEWWHVTLHLLLFPPQTVVWTLRTPQLTGQESFTMGGEGRFLQALALTGSNVRPDSLTLEPVAKVKEKAGKLDKKSATVLRLVK